MYSLLRRLLFLLEPETAHYFSMNILNVLCRFPPAKSLLQSIFTTRNPNKVQFTKVGTSSEMRKLNFRNPVGLGAGFDKNAKYLNALGTLGFGFIEIGTVTPKPQLGNEKPRLFRLPKDKALINRMGFNNDGANKIATRLKHWRKNNPQTNLIIGGNLGKNKSTPNEEAWKDYLICFETLHPFVDYFVINVSSPNTPGLRALQDKESLQKIFSSIQQTAVHKSLPKPLLLKIAPDLEHEQVDEIIELAATLKLDGLIVSNTTIERKGLLTDPGTVEKIGMGGLSGKPIAAKSTGLINYIFEKSRGGIFIIGSGGIFSGSDAVEKFKAGASLVQVWTGFIYEGPSIVKKISKYLATHYKN